MLFFDPQKNLKIITKKSANHKTAIGTLSNFLINKLSNQSFYLIKIQSSVISGTH